MQPLQTRACSLPVTLFVINKEHSDSANIHGRRNRGCGGSMPPSLLGPRGYRGVQRGGPMKMIFASTLYSRQFFYSVLYKWRTFQPSVLRQNAEMYRPTSDRRTSKGIFVKEFVMVHVTCATKYQYKPFLDDPEIFHQVLSDVNPLILVLVLKDRLLKDQI